MKITRSRVVALVFTLVMMGSIDSNAASLDNWTAIHNNNQGAPVGASSS